MNRKILGRRDFGLAGLLAIGASAAFGATLTAAPPAAQAAATLPPLSELMAERVLGDPKAPVTILDYSSMTCPHCAHFHAEILPKIKEAYIDTGKVKLVFRDFPFDQAALSASMLAHCAPVERYFPLTDVLFKSQPTWSRAADPAKALAQYGKLAGMSQETIDACFANKELADAILNSRLTGQNQYKVEATPTFILNDGKVRIEGAQPFEAFAKEIDKLLK
ncbi:DsbA oxidoreductase (plasmid) [Azospirillum sp. B510]|uniref:DsbA family protein n=1 Tax=Azospirillum sp. (strain B510) TaxID=137722 RepID=UPI0001C4CBA6|nr:DsbA family protein [Azospirillum sp. B510]BAI75351.1 DsbA oxidoreductase [Azospirillum sp. B510]